MLTDLCGHGGAGVVVLDWTVFIILMSTYKMKCKIK